MRVLITGGAGFLGSHLCERLHADGHEVICVDNLITGKLGNIAHLQADGRLTVLRHDVSQPFEVQGTIDYILHFASPASPIDYLKYPIPTLKVGALGTHNTLGIAKAKGSKFLLASTSEVYGDPQVHPQPESYWGHVNCVGPRGVYDEAKRFAEALTMAYHREHHVDSRIVRIFNTYGPRIRMDDGRAIPAFVSRALNGEPLTVFGDGMQTRSFCYISDMVEGIIRLMERDVHDPVNIGNPHEISLLELAKMVIQLTDSSSDVEFKPLPVDDPKHRRPDLSNAKTLLDWEPRIPLHEGLAKTIEWFRQQHQAQAIR